MNQHINPIERLLTHDRAITFGALTLVTLLAWGYTIMGVGLSMSAIEMTNMPQNLNKDISMHFQATTWNIEYALVLLAMWWMMMIAMMLPSATPTILLAAAINRKSQSENMPYGKTAFFTGGYLFIWLMFSVLAVCLQWLLESTDIVSEMMQNSSRSMAAGLLISAGIWQFTPLKQTCLKYCQSPVLFLTRNKKPGNIGAFSMGAYHGLFCLGCCWFLMVLLFVVCVMNLYWIIGLTLFVFIEKIFARGPRFSQIAGAGLIASGVFLLF